jgi:hypothetical protein
MFKLKAKNQTVIRMSAKICAFTNVLHFKQFETDKVVYFSSLCLGGGFHAWILI